MIEDHDGITIGTLMMPYKHHGLQILGRRLFLFTALCTLMLTACENTDLQLATEAGMDAIKAATLTDKETHELAVQSARYSDSKNQIAPPGSKQAMRLQRLVGDHQQEGGTRFNYAVYLVPEVNAFAMADGTIRVYSGLMDMLTDGELRFVIGHEMGHVAGPHQKEDSGGLRGQRREERCRVANGNCRGYRPLGIR